LSSTITLKGVQSWPFVCRSLVRGFEQRRWYSYSSHSESLGVSQSTEFVEKLLSSLCILFIWPVLFKHQHFWSVWLIFQSAGWWQGTRLFITTRKTYVTFTAIVNKCISVIWNHYHGNNYEGISRLSWWLFNAAHIDNLLHSQQHHSSQFVAEKRIITNTYVLRNSGSIDDWHILKRGHLWKHYQIQFYHWYYDLCLILNGEIIHKHCLTGILLMKARMVCPQTININWYRLMLLAYPQRMYQENWPLALDRFLIMVGLSIQNLMANQPLAPSPSPWPEQQLKDHNGNKSLY